MRHSTETGSGKAGGFPRTADSAHSGGEAVGDGAVPGWDPSQPLGERWAGLGDATRQAVGSGQTSSVSCSRRLKRKQPCPTPFLAHGAASFFLLDIIISGWS